ncbi:LysR family transcriptional regulator [Paraferrimonas sedimenticola]|uniref:LysR family transcriptional regulator n=1 Tax=Paraferrimonas sedimenticola TaxID=375674 RepID=A0AA37RVZ8_9GAMM|nr:LysR family transcriptional regulator [Paraferrimonas sedimenticola]GLP96181.1 LysR family transcriptional regulator [Paraferrimonas sedimenticola]
MEYSLAQLQAFVATVEEGSFKAAALRLDKSSQVVARFISMMEDSFDLKLFERQVRRLEITEEGRKLYPHARRILLETDKFDAQLSSFERELPNTFTLAIDNTLSSRQVTECYYSVVKEFPTVDLKVLSGGTSQVLDWVKSAQVEVALVFSPVSTIKGLQDMVAFNFQTIEVAAPQLVGRGEVISQQRVADMTQIVATFVYEMGLDNTHVQGDKVITCNGFDEVVSLLLAGAGWARVPAYKVKHLLDSGALHEFVVEGAVPVNWHASLYYPDDKPLSLAADLFVANVHRLNDVIDS